MANADKIFDQVEAEMLGHRIKLSANAQKRKSMYLQIFSLIHEHPVNQHIVDKLKSLYSISDATAYRRIAEAKNLFGDLNKTNREAARQVMYVYYAKYLQRAIDLKDLKAQGAALSGMRKTLGLDNDERIDLERFKSVNVKIGISNQTKNLIRKLNEKGGGDLDVLFPEAQDAEFEVLDK